MQLWLQEEWVSAVYQVVVISAWMRLIRSLPSPERNIQRVMQSQLTVLQVIYMMALSRL